jgi:hypothetical protein
VTWSVKFTGVLSFGLGSDATLGSSSMIWRRSAPLELSLALDFDFEDGLLLLLRMLSAAPNCTAESTPSLARGYATRRLGIVLLRVVFASLERVARVLD